MKVSWLRFASNVTIFSNRTLSECLLALNLLVAKHGLNQRDKPYLGHVDHDGGMIWQRFQLLAVMPARILKFTITPSMERVVLNGKLELKKFIRIAVGIYLLFCVVFGLWGIVDIALHRKIQVTKVLGPAISYLMIYGWTYLLVRLNRKSENQMLRAIKHVMAGDAARDVVIDLLSSAR